MKQRVAGRKGILGAVVVATAALTQTAHASTNTTLSMFETPLQTLQKSLQGPVALSIGIIGVVLCGGMLIFGGELSDFAKRLSYVLLVLGILLASNTIVPLLFSSATAVIF